MLGPTPLAAAGGDHRQRLRVRSSAFSRTLERLGIQQRRVRAGRPTSNGHVERLQQTILDECWRPAFARSLVPKLTALTKDLEQYLAASPTAAFPANRLRPAK